MIITKNLRNEKRKKLRDKIINNNKKIKNEEELKIIILLSMAIIMKIVSYLKRIAAYYKIKIVKSFDSTNKQNTVTFPNLGVQV